MAHEIAIQQQIPSDPVRLAKSILGSLDVENESEFSGALSTSTDLSISEKSYAEDQSQMSNMIFFHAKQFAGKSRCFAFVGILLMANHLSSVDESLSAWPTEY
jgi:hypothetical protein